MLLLRTPCRWALICAALLQTFAPAFAAGLNPGDVVVNEHGLDIILRIDPVSGATNAIVPVNFPDSTGGLALDANGDLLVIFPILQTTCSSYVKVMRVNPATGQTNVFSPGGIIVSGRRMALARDGNLIVSGTYCQNFNLIPALFRVNLATGAQSLLTTNLVSGFSPNGVAVDRNGYIYTVTTPVPSFGVLARYNPDGTGLVTNSSGNNLKSPQGIALDLDGTILVSDSASPRSIIRIDPGTGSQAIVSSGGYFSLPRSLAVGTDRKIYVTDAAADKVLQIDPDTGTQTILATMPGPEEIIVVPVPQPTLMIVSADSQLSLLWPTSAVNFVLEFTEDLSGNPAWTATTNTSTVVGDQNQVTIGPSNATGFFRLRR